MPAASTKSSWRRQATEEQSHNAAAGRRALRGLGDFVGVAPTVPPRECAARTAAPGGGRGSRAGQTADERERCHRHFPLCHAVPRRPSQPGGGSPRFLPAPRAATSVRSRSAIGAPRRTAAPERGPAGAGSSFAADNVIGHCVVPPRSCAAAPHAFPVARTARGRAAADVDPAWVLRGPACARND